MNKIKDTLASLPTAAKAGLALLLVALVAIAGFTMFGGSSKEDTATENTSAMTTDGAQDVSVDVPDDETADLDSSKAPESEKPEKESKPTIAPPKATKVDKPKATAQTITRAPETPTESPAPAPKAKPKDLPKDKFVPAPAPKPLPKPKKPAGPQAQINQKPLPASGAGTGTPVTVNTPVGSAPIDPIRTDARGVLDPPKNVSRVGWWQDSGIPGEGAGSVVVTGHVDDISQGAGKAKAWSTLKPGQVVSLKLKKGAEIKYKITSVKHYNKGKQFPAGLLNKLDGPEKLVLVTCGGAFIGGPTGYADNIILTGDRIN